VALVEGAAERYQQDHKNVKLLRATPADLELILSHRREMFREMGGEYSRHLNAFESASRRYFEAALQDGSYYGLFCKVESEIVGGGGVLVSAWPGSPLNFDPRRAWILNLYVEREHRGRGVARAVLEGLVNWCREKGFQSVALHASESGRPLYEKLGFRPTNEMRLKL
jgi:GNAT superfamily N-acetyltransferase